MSYFGKLLMCRKSGDICFHCLYWNQDSESCQHAYETIRDEVPAELASTRAKPDNRPDMVRGNCGSSPHRLSNPRADRAAHLVRGTVEPVVGGPNS